MPAGPKRKRWMGRGVAAYFRPSTAPKKVGMFIRTCRVMKRKREKKKTSHKKTSRRYMKFLGLDHLFGHQCRGEPVCSPFTWADTQVCPYFCSSRYRLMAPSYSWVKRNTFLANRNRVVGRVSPAEAPISFKTSA